MFIRIILLLVSFAASLFVLLSANAAMISTGPSILMTGSNAGARFDVAEVLYNSGLSIPDPGMAGKVPKLNTTTPKPTFEGYFYLSGSIGWVVFNSGSDYQVHLDCGTQALSDLSLPCSLTGTGWSEIAGDVSFSGVEYVPALGELSGSVRTYAGDISLSGIYLPLRAAVFNEDITQLTASATHMLSISGAEKYGNGTWIIHRRAGSAPGYNPGVTGNPDGTFTNVDLTFADDYTITITDPSGSQTELDATVLPNALSTMLDSSPSNLIAHICSTYTPTKCPDGATLSATTIVNSGSNVIADGASYYDVRIKPRDTYGNRVNDGTMLISYTGSISSVQIPNDSTGPSLWVPNFIGDALVFSGETMIFSTYFDGKWESSSINLSGQDISFQISSVAPTDGGDNILVLQNITYTSPLGVTTTIPSDNHDIEFLPAYEVTNVTPLTTIQVNATNVFQNTINKNTSLTFTPDILTLLMVGNGSNAAFRDFSSNQSIGCQAYFQNMPASYDWDCDWQQFQSNPFPSVLSIQVGSDFTFSGTYASFDVHPEVEPVSYGTFIHYSETDLGNPGNYIGSPDIVYPSKSGNFGPSEFQVSKVKILGQNNARSEYGSIGTSKITRAKLIDAMRKNSILLSRNRDDFVGVPYDIIQTGNAIASGGTFVDKRTLVVIGGDIIIEENISPQNHPLSIIALADSEGNGGNILIDPTVTDIHASLIAEHSILNNGVDTSHQLYIYGSLLSANTLGDTAAGICPYFVSAVCTMDEAAKYDLENLRADYDGLDPAKKSTSSTAFAHANASVIVEYDMRIQSDPPPVVQ